MSAPRDIRCSSMPMMCIKVNTAAMTRGIHKATIIPERTPRLTKLTSKTMIIASARDLINSSIEVFTTLGWLTV